MTRNTNISFKDLANKIAQVATLDGEFLLRSGRVSHRYFDKYRFEGCRSFCSL